MNANPNALGEVDSLVVPAAYGQTSGRAHWEAPIRTRAIENLAGPIASVPGGDHLSGRETHGHSMIIDPCGEVLDRLPRRSAVVVAAVDPTYGPLPHCGSGLAGRNSFMNQPSSPSGHRPTTRLQRAGRGTGPHTLRSKHTHGYPHA